MHPAHYAQHAGIRRRSRHEAGDLSDWLPDPNDWEIPGAATEDAPQLPDIGVSAPDLGDWQLPGDWTPDPAKTPGGDTPPPADIPAAPPPGWSGAWPPDMSGIGQQVLAGATAGAAQAPGMPDEPDLTQIGQDILIGGAGGASTAGGAPPLEQGGGGDGGGGGGGNGAITKPAEEKFWTPTKIAVAAVLGAGGVGLIVYFATRPKRRSNPRRRARR